MILYAFILFIFYDSCFYWIKFIFYVLRDKKTRREEKWNL